MNKYFRYLGALLLSLIVVFSAFGCANKGVKAIFIVDGAEYAIVTAASRDEFVMPVSPSKEGATFAGWYLTENGGGGIFSLDSLVAGGDVYVFAKWNMEHVHTAGEVKIHKAPTCFDDGISVIECSTCGHTMSTGFIDKLSHEPSEWLVVESPSCSSEGQKQRTCNLCEAVLETAAIPKAQHTAGAESIKIPSGCETVGLAVTKCTICEEVIAERELDALGHTAGEETVITPDECEAMIVAITECTVCKEVISEIELGILGHIPGEETVKTAAGCLIAGVAVTKCSVCDAEISEREIEAKGHTLGEESVKITQGCLTAGVAVTKCSVCDAEISERELDALGHQEREIPRVEPTETRDGWTAGVECSRCFEILTEQERIPARVSGCDVELGGFTLIDTVFEATLSSDYEYFYITEVIRINEAASFVISENIDGSGILASDHLPLSFGYNTYYMTVSYGEDSLVYTLSIYKKHILTVSFVSAGDLFGFITLDEGGIITDIPEATLEGYDFIGWDVDLTLPITEDITATAQFVPRNDTPYTVIYYVNVNGEYVESRSERLRGTTDATAEIPPHTEQHYSVNTLLSDSDGIISGDGALILKVYLDPVQYSVRFEVGHSITMEKVSVTALSPYTPPTPPEVAGYRFVRWLYNGMEWTGVESMISDVYLKAEWVRLAKVSFETSDVEGLSLESLTIDVGGVVTSAIELPTAEDKAVAFFLNGEPFILGYDIVTGDMTLVAKWVDKFVTVTFETKGAVPPDPITVEYGSVIDSVPTPIRGQNYSFEGWYIKNSDIKWLPGQTPVTENITVVARWSIMTPPDIWG